MAKVIYFGVCIDSNDPSKAGRIRAVTDEDFKETQSPTDYDELELTSLLGQEKYSKYTTIDQIKWSVDDPHLVSPFLPPFINVVPQEGENVKILYYDTSNETQNKEYVGPTISSPEKYPYAEPTKISIDGRSNADIVFSGTEGEDGEITMRAGKFIPNKNEPAFPIFNQRPSTIQISNFPSKLTLVKETKVFETPVEAEIRYLVEYDVFDLETPESLTGNIKLYELVARPPLTLPTNLDSPGLTTNFQGQANLKVRAELNFTNQTVSGATLLINEFLEEVGTFNDKKLTDPPFNEGVLSGLTSGAFEKRGEYIDDFSSQASGQDQNLNLFPFYFRPAISLVEAINSQETNDLRTKAANELVKDIGITGVNNKKYYGFVLSKEEPEPTTKEQEFEEVNTSFDESQRQGIVTTLSDKIILYSYDSSIPNKVSENPITSNENNNEVGDNLGLSQRTLVEVDDNQTEPIVRGDQLQSLLKKIVLFLETHVHGEGNTPPVVDGVQLLADIKDELEKANYLNQNIRIN
jgi:hypothetical protein